MTHNSGIKQHYLIDSNILNTINNCPALINTALELYKTIDIYGDYRIETYISDNYKRQRTVIYNKELQAISACYYELESGFVIYGTTLKQYRRQGIYKQLKAYIYTTYNIKLWSQYQSADYIEAFNRQ